MYIAGLNLSCTQIIEGTIIVPSLVHSCIKFSRLGKAFERGRTESGPVKLSVPLHVRLITAIHVAITGPIRVGLYFAVVANGLRHPGWMTCCSLPLLDYKFRLPLRLLGVIIDWWPISVATRKVFSHLGSQFAAIGTREKAKVINSGPYNIVRHPLYSLVLCQLLAASLILWSYIPLGLSGVAMVDFMLKIYIEEGMIMDDPSIADSYKEYQKSVKYRLIPYVW